MPTDVDRIYDLLKGIGEKLDTLAHDTSKRLATLEERCSHEKTTERDRRMVDLERFQASAKVYISAAGVVGAGTVAALFRVLHLG